MSPTGNVPAVAFDDQGRGVVAWYEASEDGTTAIRARRLAGDALGAPFQVSTRSDGNPAHPRVALDGTGGFIVVWMAYEARGQLYRAGGRRRGGEMVLSPRGVDVTAAEVAMAPDGRFVVAWEQANEDPMRSVRVAAFSAGGGRLGRPLVMPARGTDFNLVGAVSAGADSFAVGWTEFTPCPSNPLDPVSAVATFDWSLSPLSDVDRLANDNPCVDGPQVLAMPNSELGPLGIFVGRRYSIQRFSPLDGTRVGPRTNIAELPSCGPHDCERAVAVAGDGRGRFVLVWVRLVNGHYEVTADLYGREGRRRVDRFAVGQAPDGEWPHPAAALAGDGTLLVVWRRGSEGLVMRRFTIE